MKNFILTLILCLIGAPVFAAHTMPEAYYQKQWCTRWHGKAEYELKSLCRVDCLTKNFAVEFDFAPKWAEAIGQSLYYGKMTGKKPAIILILETKKDWTYYNRLKKLCPEHGITLWYMTAPDFH